jgi:hypothetical protein
MEQNEKVAAAQQQFDSALMEHIFVPAFVKACAARNITFTDVDDLNAGLETAGLLLKKAEALKAQGVDPFPTAKKQACALLKQAFAQEEQPAAGASNPLVSAMAELLKTREAPAA